MDILSIGDCVEEGTYKLHSGFRKVKNYSCNERLLSFADTAIGNGPVNIIVDTIEGFSSEKIIVKDSRIIFDSFIEETANIPKYNSTIDEKIIKQLDIRQIQNELLPYLLKYAPPLSLAFIFAESGMTNFKFGFDKTYAESIIKAVQKISDGEIIEGVKSIKGRGFGLTPSGDDFIAGMLNALYLINIIRGNNNLSVLRVAIKNTAATKNIISSNAIHFAAEGRFNEAFRNLVISLAGKDKELIQQNTLHLLQTGETSGADLLTGFLFTFASEINFKRFSEWK